jgi:hypothetical protein
MRVRVLLAASAGAAIAGLFASASFAAWSGPETVATVSQTPLGVSVSTIKLATDAAGDLVVGWSQLTAPGSGRQVGIVVTRRAGGRWSAPLRLNSIGSEDVPSVAMSPDGEATVVWVQTSKHRGRTRDVVLARSQSPTRGWGRTHVLAASDENPNLPPFGPAHNIALDTAGNAVVVFNLGRDADKESIEVSSRRHGGTWKRAVAVAKTTYCIQTQVASAGDGELLLAWIHGDPSTGGAVGWVEALALDRRRHAEGRPQVLSSEEQVGGLDLAANARGDGVLIWNYEWGIEGGGGARVEASTRTAGRPFTHAVVVSSRGVRSHPGGVAIDQAGTATALFDAGQNSGHPGKGDRVATSTHPRDGHWSKPALVSSLLVDSPVLAANPHGDLAAVWGTEIAPAPGAQFAPEVIAASVKAGSGPWQPPAIVSPRHSQDPAVAIRPNDDVVVAWESFNTTQRIEAAEYVP